MKVLVTGGAGFIGSHLADRLVNEGHDVLVFDNEATGRRENVPAAARYITGDVTHPGELEQSFGTGLDAVFHVAGQVSLIRSFEMTPTQVRSALVVLRKTLPDLKPVKLVYEEAPSD